MSGIFLEKDIYFSENFFFVASTFSIVPLLFKVWNENLLFPEGWVSPINDSLKKTRLNYLIDLINIVDKGYFTQTDLTKTLYSNVDLLLEYKKSNEISEKIRILRLLIENLDKAAGYINNANIIDTSILENLVDENSYLRDTLAKLESIETTETPKVSFQNHVYEGILKVSLSLIFAETLRLGINLGLNHYEFTIPPLYDILVAAPLSGIFLQMKFLENWFSSSTSSSSSDVIPSSAVVSNLEIVSQVHIEIVAQLNLENIENSSQLDLENIEIVAQLDIIPSSEIVSIKQPRVITTQIPFKNLPLVNEGFLHKINAGIAPTPSFVMPNLVNEVSELPIEPKESLFNVEFTTKKEFMSKFPTAVSFYNSNLDQKNQLAPILKYSPKEYEAFVDSIYNYVNQSQDTKSEQEEIVFKEEIALSKTVDAKFFLEFYKIFPEKELLLLKCPTSDKFYEFFPKTKGQLDEVMFSKEAYEAFIDSLFAFPIDEKFLSAFYKVYPTETSFYKQFPTSDIFFSQFSNLKHLQHCRPSYELFVHEFYKNSHK